MSDDSDVNDNSLILFREASVIFWREIKEDELTIRMHRQLRMKIAKAEYIKLWIKQRDNEIQIGMSRKNLFICDSIVYRANNGIQEVKLAMNTSGAGKFLKCHLRRRH
jgi:hypothetical protein